jgi:hypothetical protein
MAGAHGSLGLQRVWGDRIGVKSQEQNETGCANRVGSLIPPHSFFLLISIEAVVVSHSICPTTGKLNGTPFHLFY